MHDSGFKHLFRESKLYSTDSTSLSIKNLQTSLNIKNSKQVCYADKIECVAEHERTCL